ACRRGRTGEPQAVLWLDATGRACELLGDVHTAAPALMLTGRNGKTSTARMVDTLLTAHNLRVGRFTGPHLTRVTERISVDGDEGDVPTVVRVYDGSEQERQRWDAGPGGDGRTVGGYI